MPCTTVSTAWRIHRFRALNVCWLLVFQMATKNNLVTFEAAVGAAASVAFAGYALHTNIVKAQELQDEAKTDKAVAEFPETFKRGRKVQVPLALAATAGGLVGFYLTGNPAFAAGATLAGALHVASGTFVDLTWRLCVCVAAAPLPWTAVAMKPTIDELIAEAEKEPSARDKAKARRLLKKVPTALCLVPLSMGCTHTRCLTCSALSQWNALHAARTAVSVAAAGVFGFLLYKQLKQ